MSATAPIPAINAKPGTVVQAVPGKIYSPVHPESIDSIAIVELVPAGDGTFRPVARICPRRYTVSEDNLRRLGIAISTDSINRLIEAGFIKGERVTPNTRQFDYLDYLRHEEETADPEFWTRTEPGEVLTNFQRYQQVLWTRTGGGSRKTGGAGK